MRITQKDLERQVNTINELTDNPKGYEKGSYILDYAYGGVKLAKIVNDAGGQTNISNGGYGTKRELYNFMNGFILGLEKN